MAAGKGKFSSKDLINKLMWALIGYFASLYGFVNLPVDGVADLLI